MANNARLKFIFNYVNNLLRNVFFRMIFTETPVNNLDSVKYRHLHCGPIKYRNFWPNPQFRIDFTTPDGKIMVTYALQSTLGA